MLCDQLRRPLCSPSPLSAASFREAAGLRGATRPLSKRTQERGARIAREAPARPWHHFAAERDVHLLLLLLLLLHDLLRHYQLAALGANGQDRSAAAAAAWPRVTLLTLISAGRTVRDTQLRTLGEIGLPQAPHAERTASASARSSSGRGGQRLPVRFGSR
eukprot:COSAG06_NODE_19_length_34432_cov_10.651832_16_plen_161_part_00